jgi:precorrin-6B methylase 2
MIAGVPRKLDRIAPYHAATFPENAFMTARDRFAPLTVLLALVLSAPPLFAQATATQKPQTEKPTTTQKPATTQKPYEPQVGQEGKDVVWVPTPQALVDKMLDMAKITPQDFLMDLGSGDGRTVITAAKRGTRAMGIEYNPDMVELSKKNAAAAGVSDKATFVKADLFETDFSKATVITMFLLPSINIKLRPKILDLKPGTRVVSNTFTMEDWQADETATISDDCTSWCTALLWIVPAKVEGAWTMPQGELKLTQQFQNVTGTLGSTAVTGKLRGNDLTFTAGNVKYSGKVEGNMIHGTSSGTNGKPWMATKK